MKPPTFFALFGTLLLTWCPLSAQLEKPYTYTLGTEEGMPLFPSTVPGQPGVDPGQDRVAWAKPERVNYPGSVEHYRVNRQNYMNPINPYNHRTLIKNFIASELPSVSGGAKETFSEPEQYVYKGNRKPIFRTGEFRPAVPVVRLKPGGERLKFTLPAQKPGLYAVRVIAALETKNTRDTEAPLSLVLDLRINDGLNGKTSHYILRERGTDNFYALGEFFFRAEDQREWTMDVGLHPDSEVDLLVHNVDVHDVFAELPKRGGKTASVVVSEEMLDGTWKVNSSQWLDDARNGRWNQWYEAVAQKLEESENVAGDDSTAERVSLQTRLKKILAVQRSQIGQLRKAYPSSSAEELMALCGPTEESERAAWESLPPINFNYAFEKLDISLPKELEAQFLEAGLWDQKANNSSIGKWVTTTPWALVRKTENGEERYTAQDLRESKSFPGFPFPVHPWGQRLVDREGAPHFFNPLAYAVGRSVTSALTFFQRDTAANSLLLDGDLATTHHNAIRFCRLVYDLPTYSFGHSLMSVHRPASRYFNWCVAHQHRHRHYQTIEWDQLARTYDQLFPFIKDNQALATAIGRHVSWVKTSADIVRLLDTYLLQYAAREAAYFRYYYNHDHAAIMMQLAAIQGDAEITAPWMWVMFNKTWEYPLGTRDLRSLIYSSSKRDGTTTIGSSFYSINGSTYSRMAPWMQAYLRNGGDPQYNLMDPERFPRIYLGPYFPLESRVAGLHSLGVGDVGSPSVRYGRWMDQLPPVALDGWKITRDPKFAYLLKNYPHPQSPLRLTTSEQAELDAAVASVTRDPFFAQRSRVLSDWGGILEGGTQSDDFRYRHAVRIRVGHGVGHAHEDGLDLGLWSQGVVMTGDAAARPGYAWPGSNSPLVHNLATIESRTSNNSWISDLSDFGEVQYLQAKQASKISRQVALIEVDQGTPAADSKAEGILPRAYVVDFYRVPTGKDHAYNFHGPPHDKLDVNIEADATLTPEDEASLADYPAPGRQWAADVQTDSLQVTWQMSREKHHVILKNGKEIEMNTPAEQEVLGPLFREESPRKHLRVHVLGEAGRSRLRSGLWVNSKQGYFFQQMHLHRAATEKKAESTLFAALWEPYSGESFIRGTRLVRYDSHPSDLEALQPAAVFVEIEGGIQDVIYTAAQHDNTTDLGQGMSFAAQFAYLSQDADGLRELAVTEGNSLQTPSLQLTMEVPRWEAMILEADPLKRTARLDQEWPANLLNGSYFELGGRTSFEALDIQPDNGSTCLHWRKGIDIFSSIITRTERNETGKLALYTEESAPSNKFFVATDKSSTFQPVSRKGPALILQNGDVNEGDFPVGSRINGYEAGPGDSVRIASRFRLHRLQPATYRIHATSPFQLTLKGKADWSIDGKQWHPLPVTKGVAKLDATTNLLRKAPLYLRWKTP